MEVTLELGRDKQTRWGQEREHWSHTEVWNYKSIDTFKQDKVADMTA